jgi:O-acetyl-ADP-ribose deacetylase (regulator of RNase III)
VLLGLLDMIRFVKGNLLESSAQALVNIVNTGVMGKGIASQFKEAYPNNYILYKKACKD